MVLPSSAADSAATAYCASVSLPKVRHSVNSEGLSDRGGGGGDRASPAVSDGGGSRSASPMTVGGGVASPPRGGRKSLRKGNTMSNLTLEAEEDGKPAPGVGKLKRQNTMGGTAGEGPGPKKGMKKGKSSKNFGS